jgi:hypothetical protein
MKASFTRSAIWVALLFHVGLFNFCRWWRPVSVVVFVVFEKMGQAPLMSDGHLVLAFAFVALVVRHLDKFSLVSLYLGFLLSSLLRFPLACSLFSFSPVWAQFGRNGLDKGTKPVYN